MNFFNNQIDMENENKIIYKKYLVTITIDFGNRLLDQFYIVNEEQLEKVKNTKHSKIIGVNLKYKDSFELNTHNIGLALYIDSSHRLYDFSFIF